MKPLNEDKPVVGRFSSKKKDDILTFLCSFDRSDEETLREHFGKLITDLGVILGSRLYLCFC